MAAPPEITFDYIVSEQFLVDTAAKKVDIDVKLSGRTALMIAIEMLSGRVKSNSAYERVKKLIELGSGLEARSNHWQTAIHYACRAGSVGALKLILDTVASWPEQKRIDYINDNGNGCTPLYYTCDSGHRKMTQMLINSAVDIEKRTGREKMPAVYYAAMRGHLRIVKKFPMEMLRKFYQPLDFKGRAKSILLGAVYGNEIAVVDWLLWKKVPVTIGGRKPIQPIDVAAELEEYAIFKILVPYMSDIQMTNNLARWIFDGRIELFEIVIDQFDKRHLKIPPWGQQANFLLCAIGVRTASARRDTEKTLNKTHIAFALIDRGEPLNPPLAENKNPWSIHSPLTMALTTQNLRIARYMLEKGADPNLGLGFRPLGTLAYQIYPSISHPNNPDAETRWGHAWNLMKLCLDYGADPDEIADPKWTARALADYADEGLFTCMIYKSYLHVDRRNEEEKALRTEIFREFVKRGLGFKVEWPNTRDKPSKLVTELLTDIGSQTGSGLWSGAKYDEEEEIYVIDQDIVATRCPAGCQFYGCEHTETPIRINTKGCKHIFCAGHVRKLIEMNKKLNRERRREGGNQLALKCPVCRAPVKDFQLMSTRQVENWIRVEEKLKAATEEEKTKVAFQNENLRAIYKVFAQRKTKKERALQHVRARLAELEEELKKIKDDETLTAARHIDKKKELQAAGIARRKELRDKQYILKETLKF
jgi:ankyrin repeat protein